MRWDLLLGGVVMGALGLLVAGCEDPPPPTPSAAFNVQFSQVGGGGCSIGSHQVKMGTVEASGEPKLVTSGAENTESECSITKSGAAFNITANLDGEATLGITITGMAADASEASPADGTVTFASTGTAGNVFRSPTDAPCKFWIDADNGQYLKDGEAWLTFECLDLTNGMNTCAANTSYVALKNCEGAAAEE